MRLYIVGLVLIVDTYEFNVQEIDNATNNYWMEYNNSNMNW